MGNSIPISPKHGLNPAMDVCCWCGQPKGVALMGRLKNDAEAPQKIVTSYDPCDTCKKKWSNCVIVFEVTHNKPNDGRPPIGKDNDKSNVYPTMRLVGIDEEVASQINIPCKNGQQCIMEDIAFDKIFGNGFSESKED